MTRTLLAILPSNYLWILFEKQPRYRLSRTALQSGATVPPRYSLTIRYRTCRPDTMLFRAIFALRRILAGPLLTAPEELPYKRSWQFLSASLPNFLAGSLGN